VWSFYTAVTNSPRLCISLSLTPPRFGRRARRRRRRRRVLHVRPALTSHLPREREWSCGATADSIPKHGQAVARNTQQLESRRWQSKGADCLQGPHPVRSMHSPTHQDESCVLVAVRHSPRQILARSKGQAASSCLQGHTQSAVCTALPIKTLSARAPHSPY
jgi:hypothetical protein